MHVCACVCACVCVHGNLFNIGNMELDEEIPPIFKTHGQVCKQEPGLSCGWTCYRPEVVRFSSILDVFVLHVYIRRVRYLFGVQLLELSPAHVCSRTSV